MSGPILNILAVAIGGALGSASRYALSAGVHRLGSWTFPIGTICVNILGCLAIGFLSVRFQQAATSSHVRMGVLVGALGGFTTFSSFSLETWKLLDGRQAAWAVFNVVGTVVLCLAACWAGRRIALGITV